VIEKGCNSTWPNYDDKTTEELFKDMYLQLVDRSMCTQWCYCDS